MLRRRLVSLARPLRCTRATDASGRCLALSLRLAAQARDQLGLDLRLVRWHVRNDRDFAEHWAVELSDHEMLDPTRVQVDGRAEVRVRADSYPPHYTHQRRYPAALLLQGFERAEAAGDRLPAGFVAACAARMFRYDLHASWRLRSPRYAIDTLCHAWRFASVFTLNCLSRRLEHRATSLLARLDQQATLPTRLASPRSGRPVRRS